MAEELKACPFCGGKAETVQFTRKRWTVECLADGCGAGIISQGDMQTAIAAWNTRAQLPSQGGEAVAWREHSVNYAKGEKCPETIETLQAAWDRDQELINDMRHEIARHKTRINRLEQRRPAGQVADDLTMVKVSRELLERLYRVHKPTMLDRDIYELRALLAKSEGVK